MVCSKCGTENPDDAKFCIGCGARFVSGDTTLFAGSGIEYGGFWERFLAYFIDSIVIGLGSILVLFAIAILIGIYWGIMDMNVEESEGFFTVLYYILAILSTWLYYTIMESSKIQATLGKKVCNLVVTDSSGNRITFARANARFWSKMISGAIFAIGYIMAAFTEKHQALHDMIADTLVVKKKD